MRKNLAWGKTCGLQGDPQETIVFCLSIHHLWGRTLDINKHLAARCLRGGAP